VLHVPELVLGAGGDHGARAGDRVGPEEREVAPDHLDLARLDVLLDELREDRVGVLLAERALEVGELVDRDLRIGVAERVAALGDPLEQRGALGLLGLVDLLVAAASTGARDEHGHDDDRRDRGKAGADLPDAPLAPLLLALLGLALLALPARFLPLVFPRSQAVFPSLPD
jgi:hypothetical protein